MKKYAKKAEISKKELIRRAAVKIFARKGYYRCRIADIMNEANIAYGLFYHYYPSKEEILLTIYRSAWSRFLGKLDEIEASSVPPHEKLKEVIGYLYSNYRDHPDLMKVLIMDVPRLDAFYEETCQILYDQYFHRIADIFKQGQEKGIFIKEIPPDMLSSLLHGSIDGVIRKYVYSNLNGEFPMEPTMDTTTFVFMEGITRRT